MAAKTTPKISITLPSSKTTTTKTQQTNTIPSTTTTVQDFVKNNPGYTATWDKSTNTSTIKSPTGQSVSFVSGQNNSNLGISGQLSNNSNVVDANKLKSVLAQQTTQSTQSTPTQSSSGFTTVMGKDGNLANVNNNSLSSYLAQGYTTNLNAPIDYNNLPANSIYRTENQSLANNTYVQPANLTNTPSDYKPIANQISNQAYTDNINSQYDNLVTALKAKIQQSINNKNLEINGLGQKYQPLKNESEVRRNSDLRSILEQNTNTGDRGGIGRQNALETQTAADNRLNDINLQQTSEETNLKNDIANLILEGNVQEAQLQAQKLQDLLAQSNSDKTLDYQKSRDAINDQRYASETAYNQSQDALNRTDNINKAQGYVNPTAGVNVPDSVRQQLAQYSNDYTAYANANPGTELGNYARVLANEKIFSSPELLAKYGGVYKTADQKQQELSNVIAQQQFDYQKQRDSVADSQWQKTMNLNLRQQTFAEAQQKIENALSQKRINQEGASQALAWARFNADQDPNSLDNQYKKAQIDALQGKGGLVYKDYVNSGRDMLDKGNYDSTTGMYSKMYTTNDVLNWVKGLPLDATQKAQLANDLGLPK